MAEDKEGNAENQQGVSNAIPAARAGQAEVPAARSPDEQDEANGAAGSRQDRQHNARNPLRRITFSEWVTAFIGFGSLVVSCLTYQIAADTSDLKAAVGNLTNLASQARLQADAMQTQAKAMQGQLDQMTAARRPWLLTHDLAVETIDVIPDIPMIMISANYKITNFGQSPAVDVFINTGLFVDGIDPIHVGIIRNLCARRPFGSELFFFYRDIMTPGKTEEIIGFPILNGAFTRDIRSLQEKRMSKVDANFVLGGCITYRFLGNDTLHETGFAIRARSARVRIVNRVVELEQVQISKKERVELRDLMLTSIPDLSFAD